MKLYNYNNKNYIKVVSISMDEIQKIDLALCREPTETPDAYYNRQTVKPDVITNGGFFAMNNGNTCFGFRDEGVSKTFATYNGMGITGDKTLSYGKNQAQNSNLRDFISAYPALVEYGKKANINYADEIDYNARRTAIGWNDTTYYIVCVDSPGIRFSPLADIFLDLGAKFAINLDGGGSTRLLVNGVRKTDVVYARPVDNVMCVYLKKESENTGKTIYRVQVGAFKIKNNANNLLADLKSKGYSDAYIRNMDGYYKVQVGAFSVKLNAERLRDRLREAGYSTIISTK